MTANPPTFLDLDAGLADYQAARFAVLPVPYDGAVSFMSGARHGPAAIIAASAHVEEFDEELCAEYHEAGIATLDAVEANPAGPAAVHEDIFGAARRVVDDGKFLFGLGGDHSVTSGLVRAGMTRHPTLSVLQIDAHPDLRDSYEGTPFSHASVMRRVHDFGAKIVPVGIRSISKGDYDFMHAAGITPITARQCATSDEWIDRAVSALGDTGYVTIDIDGFDPAFAPGTGTPEPGGLDWYQVTGLLRRVAEKRTVVAADVVEVLPIPGQVVTEFLAARLAYKVMSYVQAARG